MGGDGLIKSILMWPSAVYTNITVTKRYLATAVGLGVPMYFMGVPSAEMSGMELAQWYLATGVAVAVSDYYIETAMVTSSNIGDKYSEGMY
jgi:hypothetical protein